MGEKLMDQSCDGVKKTFVKPDGDQDKDIVKNVIKGIEITDVAAEKILHFLKQDKLDPVKHCLFISVERNGCSGQSYTMEMSSIQNCVSVGARRFEKNGAVIMIAKTSYLFVVGSILTYKEALSGSGFSLINPNAKSFCSCGSSFKV